MKMELIQPFINSADAVLAQSLQCETRLKEDGMQFEIEGRPKHLYSIYNKMVTRSKPFDEVYDLFAVRIILDTDPGTAMHIAAHLAGGEVDSSDDLVRETICELANMVIGNAITSLNDQGFRFKISPPQVHAAEHGLSGNEETEALVMCFETAKGSVFMNIAMHYKRRRKEERAAAVVG